jgi:hypothetical protein
LPAPFDPTQQAISRPTDRCHVGDPDLPYDTLRSLSSVRLFLTRDGQRPPSRAEQLQLGFKLGADKLEHQLGHARLAQGSGLFEVLGGSSNGISSPQICVGPGQFAFAEAVQHLRERSGSISLFAIGSNGRRVLVC